VFPTDTFESMGDKNCNKISKLGSDSTPNSFWQDNQDRRRE